MSDSENPTKTEANDLETILKIEPSPATPWGTIFVSLFFMLSFAFVVIIVDAELKKLQPGSDHQQKLQKLTELQNSEAELLNRYRFDEPRKSYQIPIAEAMDHVYAEMQKQAKKKQGLQIPKATLVK